MPNHITNVLRVSAYKHREAPDGLVDQILDAVKGDDRPFDFNRLIPMSPSLRVTSGSYSSYAAALTDDLEAARMLSYPWVASAGIKDLDGLRAHLRDLYAKSPEEGLPTLDDFAQRLQQNVVQHGAADWYHWAVNNWGTKWNAYSAIVGKIDDQEAYAHFETAWSPPIPVLDALAAKFPKANFRLIWLDEGGDTYHRVYWEDGKREKDDE